MTSLKNHPSTKSGMLRPTVTFLALMTVSLGILYPLTITGAGAVLFPFQSNGSIIHNHAKKVAGSQLIGQSFTRPNSSDADPTYFQPRPSTTDFNPQTTAFSNLGPNSADLTKLLRQRVATYRRLNQLPANTAVPSDAVMSSASGLDPEISPENARLQAKRVAASRSVPLQSVLKIIKTHTKERWLGVFGEPRVNVTELNRKLDSNKVTQ